MKHIKQKYKNFKKESRDVRIQKHYVREESHTKKTTYQMVVYMKF